MCLEIDHRVRAMKMFIASRVIGTGSLLISKRLTLFSDCDSERVRLK